MFTAVSSFPADIPPTLSDLISTSDTMYAAMSSTAPAYRFGFLRNVTLEGIEPYLRYHMLRMGLRPELIFGGYGSIRQDLILPDSPLVKGCPDLLVTAFMLEELDPHYGLPGWNASHCREELSTIFDALAASDASTISLNTFIVPFRSETGTLIAAPDIASEVIRLNDFVRTFVREHSPRFCLMDWDRLAYRIGEAEAMDYRYWYISKAPFKRSFLDALARELTKVVLALKGHSKKCLVLDCDNTLWGGVVGEDGIEGIHLDGHDYPGRAYYDFQKTVLQLAERGVLITLCSKNNEQDVLDVLDKHPWSLLKRNHLSGFRINWDDKAANLVELAKELNLGLDAFVFVDDNRRELELIRQVLPQVTTLQVPDRLYEYPALLQRDGLFDTLLTSQEDKLRTSLYQTEAQRKAERNQHPDLESYLLSLQLVVNIQVATDREAMRVVQLTQKTNQFNLTTRRYSDHDIARFRSSKDACVYTLSASDRFGSLGLVGVFIVQRRQETALVDSLLMSCRALGRRLEIAFVLECMRRIVADWGILTWEAEYLSTAKNSQVADFWSTLGFALLEQADGRRRYRLQAAMPEIDPPSFIHIEGE
ncbi:HAD-superfamily phosphatase, subfamily IIIC/FkbH-like domain-containing protein [Nitrosospira multiformis]|uniref:HAD-superfamily phosphatase, subfamily IIIC/FkbH-like domain-containing protein n=1 Tax=Nitrosospira multiformis TaxID=1231 RepID=A0A1I0A6M0_9PROT|nr:HAD-IIIC family phosphatase [Nitrosospira multiformis]SES89324.1 HAD-superfamily phosphatase, subfamily IIIC/FkbH-like domain-containing protein [Nitrosospira multiformis]